MGKRTKTDQLVKLRRLALVAMGWLGCAGAGIGLWVLGPIGVAVLGGLALACFWLAAAVIFSQRDEPSRRLERLLELVLGARKP